MSEHFVNFDNPNERGLFLSKARDLQGMHRITVIRLKPRRSDRQNRYYWPCFVQVFGDYLRGQGETITDDAVHEMLKMRFLLKTVLNKETGEVIGDYPQGTKHLNTSEFNEYLDKVAEWLSRVFGITVPSPDEYHERDCLTVE
jgi:hypothetical protein